MNNSNAQLSESREGFQTKIWGSPLWLFLHMISLNYTPDRKEAYKSFLEALKGVLPCKACRNNYGNIIEKKLPLNKDVFKSRESMALYIFFLHNIVQQDIYSKSNNPSDKPLYKNTKSDFYKAMKMYEGFRAECVKDSYGCIKPLKGSKKRTKIEIVKYSKPRKTVAIINKSI